MNDLGDRDASVDRWLRRTVTMSPGDEATDACLDAETIAAWADGGLSNPALEMAREHAAGCARCQALIATMARAEASAPPAESERHPRRWLAWLVPLAAAAAVVVAVRVIRLERPPSAERARAPEAIPTEEHANAASEKQPNRLAEQQVRVPESAPPSPSLAKAAEPKNLDAASRSNVADKMKEPTSAVTAPAPAAAARSVPPAQADAGTLQREAFGAASTILEIRSPDPAFRWRVSGATVERSTDGGSTWTSVPTGVAAPLTAGAAPSGSVCWLVGRAGLVLVSTDGQTWRRLPFPEATDLVAIAASDAQTATATTADGRQLRTTDGGLTWIRRPLQES